MRLCIATREYPPVTAYTGGIGTTFATLAPSLARLGHDVHVVTVTRGPGRRETLEGVELEVVRRPNPERLWFLEDAGWTVAVARAIRRLGRFDAVFAAEWGGDAALYSLRRSCGPLVTHLTTSLEQALEISPGWKRSRRMRLRHRIQHRLEHAQTVRSDALVASSRAILAWARRNWDIERVPSVVLPNGVRVDRIREQSGGPLPDGYPHGDGPVVAFTGRLEIRKGVDVLVDAMRTVWSESPEARLVMMGSDGDWDGGRMSDHLVSLAGAQSARLHILGRQSPERLFAGLRAADVVAMPSRWENFAVGALETLALGRPLVATSGSGYDDFVEDGANGILVPPGDAGALAGALVRLLGDPELRTRLGTAAGERILDLEADAVAARFADFFAGLASR